jgi:peroxiredoxin
MKRLFFALILCSLSITSFAQSPIVGIDMPKAVFYKADGKTFATDQIPKGTRSLLMLFDATCEHCQKVATEISKRSTELNNVNFYLISQDEYRSINYFMDHFGKPLKARKNVTVLQDKDRVFIPLFHPKQYPALYLYGKDKKLEFYSSDERDVSRFFSRIASK